MLSAEYSAGFFDGEGSVYAAIRQSKSKYRPSPTVLVCISNTNKRVLEAHKEKYGGSVYGKKRRDGHQPVFQWVLGARMAYHFLKDILPHCIIKYDVIVAALALADLLRKPAHERVDYSKTIEHSGRKWVAPVIRPEFRDACWEQVSEIRRLNKRGAPYNATRQYDA